jgi:hypothetical protein
VEGRRGGAPWSGVIATPASLSGCGRADQRALPSRGLCAPGSWLPMAMSRKTSGLLALRRCAMVDRCACLTPGIAQPRRCYVSAVAGPPVGAVGGAVVAERAGCADK